MIGKRLAHYEISSQLGKGGMGEVYQAKDQKLGREVAIKVLPEEFAKDTDRVARFQREAKLLASLNHSNIASIYGLEESDGTHFLVLELIEGETLSERLKRGPIPVEEALKLGLQIAEALEAAHEKGVIHRDLKPANIKVTPDGKVKVLDFGLAKAYAGDPEDMDLSNSPTLSDAATRQGVILGTAAYMSPEQARGKPVDRRADIWAFGCVLYEMLTGKQVFSGRDVTDTLAAVIRAEPDWSSLPANLHGRLREVMERCLEKEARDRYSGVNDARIDIQRVLSDPGGLFVQPTGAAEPRSKLGTMLPWAVGVLGIVIAGLIVWNLRTPEPAKVVRFDYELPEGQQSNRGQAGNFYLAVSPDGGQFVYGTTDGLYLRSVDQLDARLIAGTDENSILPFFSPDGQWIGYFSQADRQLKKIAVSGGAPIALCNTATVLGSPKWCVDNTVVYSQFPGGVMRVSANGGTPESLIKAGVADLTGESGFPVSPQILPDGKAVLLTNVQDVLGTKSQIVIQLLESGEKKALFAGNGAQYLPTGHIIYTLAENDRTNLFAVAFDLDRLETKGGPVSILEGAWGGDVSDSGTLVYVPQPAAAADSGTGIAGARTLVWVDRKGREEPLNAPPNVYGYPKISPDGTQVALTVVTNRADIWVWDFARKTLTPLTFEGAYNITPVWTPDGKRIIFCSLGREGSGPAGGLYWKASDGTGEVELLYSAQEGVLAPYSLSSDGNSLALVKMKATEDQDLGILSMEGNRELKVLLQKDYMEIQPQISPDGRFVAYSSNESGQSEIYVRPLPDVDKGRWRVSTSGGDSPLWSRDGRELFYLTGNTEAIWRVPVETEPAFKAANPELLFKGKYVGARPSDGTPWDINPDGKRFLMIKEPETTGGESATGATVASVPRKITIVLNWFEELKARVPGK